MSDSLRHHGLQQARLPCPSPTPGVYLNSCSLSRWCHPTISSSVIPFFWVSSWPRDWTWVSCITGRLFAIWATLEALSFQCLVRFSRSVMSDSLWPYGLQHTRPPCPSPTPGVYPISCPLSQWGHNHLILCRPLLLLPSIFPSIRVFSNESALRIR